jgi:hypothetical protein
MSTDEVQEHQYDIPFGRCSFPRARRKGSYKSFRQKRIDCLALRRWNAPLLQP